MSQRMVMRLQVRQVLEADNKDAHANLAPWIAYMTISTGPQPTDAL